MSSYAVGATSIGQEVINIELLLLVCKNQLRLRRYLQSHLIRVLINNLGLLWTG